MMTDNCNDVAAFNIKLSVKEQICLGKQGF